MPLRFNGLALTPIYSPAVPTAPGKPREREHFFLQRVIRRDGHFTSAIHLCHLPDKVQAVIGPALQHVELPLMNHLMGERVKQFPLRVGRPFGELLQERARQTNFLASTR